jgi:hypothetical protein
MFMRLTKIDRASTAGGKTNMSDYRIEKDRFSVKLFFSDGKVDEGNIYLSLQAANHEGRESVRDVLNQLDLFLPVNFPMKSTKLVNKRHLLMVSFPSNEGEEDLGAEANPHDVVLHLTNGVQIEGKFIFLLPPHSSRVKDYLSQTDSFMELRRQGEIYLVNKRHIIFVEEK